MKFFLLVILMASIPAYAENWQMLADSQDGQRLIVDVDSANIDKYTKNVKTKEVGIRVRASMMYIDPNVQTRPFISAIDGDDCIYRQAGSIVNVFDKKTVDTYFWSMQGTKMYDTQGQWLCNFLVTAVEYHDSVEKSKPKSKQKIRI